MLIEDKSLDQKANPAGNMSLNTKIQWCDDTVNPTMGCDGCELWSAERKSCYAGVGHVFRRGHPGFAPKFEEVTLFPGRMAKAARWSDLTGEARPEKPWLDGLPRLIFVSDMSDALSAAVPFEYLAREIIENVTSDLGRRHQWLWLTKRPHRMATFYRWLWKLGKDWPVNLWAGTSITTQATATRIKGLLQAGNRKTIRFLSVEPQIEPVDLTPWLPRLNWVIQGGESGRTARPFHTEWAESLRGQCRDHDVPFAAVFQKRESMKLRIGSPGLERLGIVRENEELVAAVAGCR
jgi:protein gp37